MGVRGQLANNFCFSRQFAAFSVYLATLLANCGGVRAGFDITSSRYASGADDVIVFRALNDGLGDQSGTTKLQSASITLQSVGKTFIFNFQDVDGDGATDANVKGVGFSFPTSSTSTMPTGSFIRIGSTSSFFIPNGGTTPQAFTDPDGDGVPNGNNPVSAYANLFQFSVQGSIPGGGVAANLTPAAFAVAVVPSGATVDLTGELAAEAGPIESVSGSNSVPEPGSAVLFACMASFLALRRRTSIRVVE